MFFYFQQKTSYKMRISDWSSDVCSSDLTGCNYYRKLIAAKGSSMANAWFETVAESQRRAKKRLPAPVYGALMAGTESAVSRDGNLDEFAQPGLAPEVPNKPPHPDLDPRVMGKPLSPPGTNTPNRPH